MRILYTLLYILLLPLLLIRLFVRGRKAPAYTKRISERFGLVPERLSEKQLLWVHAVSVGETIAATPMIRKLMQENPDLEILLTTTTPTGSDRVRSAFGDKVLHYYLPYDLPLFLNLFYRALRPSMLVIMETELWPNVIGFCHAKRVPVMLVNARMSEKSCRGYKRFSLLTRPMLESLAFVAAQSDRDAERLQSLGVPSGNLLVTGSIKYDVSIRDQDHQRALVLKSQLQLQDRKVAIFASTHPGEDEQIIPMFKRLKQLFPEFLAIVVPRHPERFADVFTIADKLKSAPIKLSSEEPVTNNTIMVLGDTMGDLLALYGIADLAFVGGSLIKHGGHNALEAAAWSLPIVSGKHVFNFQQITEALLKDRAIHIVQDHYDLEHYLEAWLKGEHDVEAMGKAAYEVLKANQGALQLVVDQLQDRLSVL